MTAHDPNLSPKSNGLLRWLGLGGGDASPGQEGVGEAPQTGLETGSLGWRDKRRKQLLEDISSFMVTHRLEVGGNALSISYDVISGNNAKLTKLVEERIMKRDPVTLAWLEQAARTSNPNSDENNLNALMTKLENSIEQFGETTSAARSATTEYSSALECQVDELRRVGNAGAVITELAAIARVMLDRTREIEREMSRSEEETGELRASLEAARRDAEIDHLTGLANRRAFEATLTKEHEAALKNGEALCVAICDLDHFKRINDTHGHEAGDRVLRNAAKSLSSISGDRCFVARHGGEEFVVLFRGKSLDEAWQMLDDARETMAARRLVNRSTDQPFGMITFSAGIADVLSCESPREALRAADDALYAAKNSGRNKVLKAAEVDGRQAA